MDLTRILFCIYLLYLVNAYSSNQTSDWKNGIYYLRAHKSDDNQTDTLEIRNTKSRHTREVHGSYKPCDAYDPVMPNYSSSKRRISAIKCHEYIWSINTREEKTRRYNECRSSIHGRRFIIGGRTASPGEYLHMAAIGWKASKGTWIFKCGGSLISPKFVLTAAHCTRVSTTDTSVSHPYPKIVRLGDKNILDTAYNGYLTYNMEISRIIRHPLYGPPKKYYDVGLLEMAREVEFSSYISPACLWPKFNVKSLGPKATVTGWGVVKTGGLKTSPVLKAAIVDFVDSSNCDRILSRWCNRLWCGVHNHQICAGTITGGTDTCKGDSGGPLQLKISLPKTKTRVYYIVGITSFGVGCGIANVPAVYSRVSSFLDWIESVVWPHQ